MKRPPGRATGRPRGRRRGDPSVTRKSLVVAASELFAEHGYEGVSFRQIARRARVDPNLIYHYFEGKEALFLESLQLNFQPLRPQSAGGLAPGEDLGERIVKRFLDLWTGNGTGRPFLAILRACATSDRAAAAIRRFAAETVLPSVRPDLDKEAAVRTALVGGQLFGLGVARHLLRLEPLVSLSDDQLARRLGPAVTATLLGSSRATVRPTPPK